MKNKSIRKLTRIGKRSYGITLPIDIVRKYDWRERQKLSVKDEGRGRIEVGDWRRR